MSGSTYPARILREDGTTFVDGAVEFTDAADQPQPGAVFNGWTSDAADPANVDANGGTLDGLSGLTLLLDEGELNVGDVSGHPGFNVDGSGDAGTTRATMKSSWNTLDDGNTGAATFAGVVDAAGLGPTIPYVTDAAAPPSAYVTPLVFDHTAVTGGLYAWDGSAYIQVGGPIS